MRWDYLLYDLHPFLIGLEDTNDSFGLGGTDAFLQGRGAITALNMVKRAQEEDGIKGVVLEGHVLGRKRLVFY